MFTARRSCVGGFWWSAQGSCSNHHRGQLEGPPLQPGGERRNGRHDSHLRRDAAGGPTVATTAKPVDEGAVRLMVEDDELEGAAVVAVLLSPDGRVIAQRRTVVGGN